MTTFIAFISFESGLHITVDCDQVVVKLDDKGNFSHAEMYINDGAKIVNVTPPYINWKHVEAIEKKERYGKL